MLLPAAHLVPTVLAALLAVATNGGPDDPPTPAPGPLPSLPTAHAHNDYRHADPCTGALDLGFASIEVDVFPVDGELLVGHTRSELRPDRTIRRLYLDPLRRRAEAATDPDQGPLPDGGRLTLLVDAKRDGNRVLDLLLEQLAPLRPWLARVEDARFIDGPLMVVLSGSRPVARVAAMTTRPVFIDGRLGDLDRDPPRDLVPIVSGSYGSSLETPLFGPPSEAARRRLRDIVARAHAQGRRVRFWGHFEDPFIWTALVEAGVDLIGTDDRARLAAWLRAHDPRCGGSAPDPESSSNPSPE